jgi:hypothetical protein
MAIAGFRGDLDVQRRPPAGVTRDRQSTAKFLDAVQQTDEARSFGGVCSADSVISNPQIEVCAP